MDNTFVQQLSFVDYLQMVWDKNFHLIGYDDATSQPQKKDVPILTAGILGALFQWKDALAGKVVRR